MNWDTFRLEKIIFIPGGQIIANDIAGERLLPRLQEGLRLWINDTSKLILVSGGITHAPEIQTTSEAIIMKKWLKDNGIPDEKIITEEFAFDTFENVRLGLILLTHFSIEAKTIEIVSEYLHTIRIALALREFGFEGEIRRISTSIPLNWKRLFIEIVAIIYCIFDRRGTGWIARNKKARRKASADYFSPTA